ncbi:MAG: HAMP domain-containing sensor histidine kinase [Candidatus Kapabacteria bacterium]|nr:HAMP domain-containing sensor histidine kinase [Candidatus Kapabacteria bacterium]
MTLRRRLYFLYVGVFTVVLLGALISIYAIYAQYRRDVFYDRLRSRIYVTTKLLFEIRTKDEHLMDVLDDHTIHSLFDEKILIFDEKGHVVYSSIDDTSIEYSPARLEQIRKEGEWRTIQGNREVLGLHYTHDGGDFVALSSATDVTGLRMINHLATALIASFAVGIGLMLLTSRLFVSRTLLPISRLSNDIAHLGPADMRRRLSVPDEADEISVIAVAFNDTLDRLTAAFEFQMNFVHYASHELNTPLSVIRAILDRMSSGPQDLDVYQHGMDEIAEVQDRITDLLSSLLILTGLDSMQTHTQQKVVRMDDIVFDVAEVLAQTQPAIQLHIELEVDPSTNHPFEIKGTAPLLRTAVSNVLGNAMKYTSDTHVRCLLSATTREVVVRIMNNGTAIPLQERELIFRPFIRLSSSAATPGKGLGLAIVRRIMELHKGTIAYERGESDGNVFELTFPSVDLPQI